MGESPTRKTPPSIQEARQTCMTGLPEVKVYSEEQFKSFKNKYI